MRCLLLLVLFIITSALTEYNTDSRDCKTCRRLRFCKGFLGHPAADCEGDDEEEDAEDKWESRIGDKCNAAAYKQFVCTRKIDPCNDDGKVVPVCQESCVQAKITCENRTTSQALEPCEGLPRTNCWQGLFGKCENKCSNLSYCTMFEGYTALSCTAELEAKSQMEELLSSGNLKQTCGESFVKSYLCHHYMQPCTDGVSQRACMSDCTHFNRYCLSHTHTKAHSICSSTHTSFYCDSMSKFLPSFKNRRVVDEAAINTNTLLMIGVVILCFIQIIVVQAMRGATPQAGRLRLASSRQRASSPISVSRSE